MDTPWPVALMPTNISAPGDDIETTGRCAMLNHHPVEHQRVVLQQTRERTKLLLFFLSIYMMQKRVLLFCTLFLCFGGVRADIFGDLLDFVFGGGCHPT